MNARHTKTLFQRRLMRAQRALSREAAAVATKGIVNPIIEEGGEAGAAFCRSPKGRPRFARSALAQLRSRTLGTRRSLPQLANKVSHPETRPSQPRGAISEVP
jgi:hypothetical protein